MKRRPLIPALLLVVACSGLLVGAAVAYVGQNPYVVHLGGPSGVVSCSSDVVITATVRSATTGELVGGQAVDWDLKVSPSPGDQLSPASTATGADGKTNVTLRFGPAEGDRTVRATIATWPATIDVTCRGGVPQPTATPTATAPAPPSATPTATSSAPPGATPTPTASALPTDPPTPPPSASAPPTVPAGSAVPSTTPTDTPPVAASGATATTLTPGPGESGPAPTVAKDPGSTPAPSPGPDLAPLAFIALLAVGLGGGLLLVRARR